jgi:hypothetical protein
VIVMLKSALRWLGCALVVVSGLALMLWLPNPLESMQPEPRSARPAGATARSVAAVPVSLRAQP